jgi:membrane-bound lytic murein transglycosylase A
MNSPIVAYAGGGETITFPRPYFLQPSRPGMLTNGSRSRRVITILLALVCSALLLGCVTQPKRVVHTLRYERATWLQLPGWDADNLQEAWNAFFSSCRALRFRSEWAAPCDAALAVTDQSPVALHNYFEQYFEPYKILKVPSSVRQDTGLITGYYEPLVMGARTPSAEFTAPLYAPPPDLLIVDLASVYPELKGKRVRARLDGNHVVPYYTRAELPIDPAVQGREIVWINSALDAFLLEIQGSGRVQLPSGEVIRLQYADQNGQPYRSIGRYLVENGELTVDQATMPGIRAWLAANPQRIQEVLNANPSVVFFNETPLGDPNVGPRGAQGIPLTPGRSIAVDPAMVPLGSPVFLATTLPASDAPLQRLVIAQDTGGAINGAPRADFFWGTGSDAAEKAGKMRQNGSMWLLWPRNAPLPTS